MFSSCWPRAALVAGVNIGVGSACPIVVPARADQIATHHGFDRQRAQAPDNDRAAFEQSALLGLADRGAQRQTGQMVGYDMGGASEPEQGNLVQHAAFAWYRIGEHDIERRQAIGGHDQHAIIVQRVQVAHFSAMQPRQAREVGLIEAAVIGQWLYASADAAWSGRGSMPMSAEVSSGR